MALDLMGPLDMNTEFGHDHRRIRPRQRFMIIIHPFEHRGVSPLRDHQTCRPSGLRVQDFMVGLIPPGLHDKH
jgi:hypothetical protein